MFVSVFLFLCVALCLCFYGSSWSDTKINDDDDDDRSVSTQIPRLWMEFTRATGMPANSKAADGTWCCRRHHSASVLSGFSCSSLEPAQLITSWTHLEIVNENASTIDGTWAINLCIVTHSSVSPAHDFWSGELGQSYTLQRPQSRLHRLLLIYVSNSGLLLVQRQSVDHALRAAPLHQPRAAPTSTTPTFITHRKPCDFHIV